METPNKTRNISIQVYKIRNISEYPEYMLLYIISYTQVSSALMFFYEHNQKVEKETLGYWNSGCRRNKIWVVS